MRSLDRTTSPQAKRKAQIKPPGSDDDDAAACPRLCARLGGILDLSSRRLGESRSKFNAAGEQNMGYTERKKGALKETLIHFDSKIAIKLSTAGSSDKKVIKENEVLYFWKEHSLSWQWKRELFVGDNATGQPLFSLKEKCCLSCYPPIKIASSSQSEFAVLKGTNIVKNNRRFVIDGVEYEWKEKSSLLASSARFELIEVMSSILLADYTYNYFSSKGVITIFESGLRLSEPLLVATALTMEGLNCRS